MEFWVWNALPPNARPIAGYLFSRGKAGSRQGTHLGIGGTQTSQGSGRLFFRSGDDVKETVVGRTPLEFRKWHQVGVVRSSSEIHVYLDGGTSPDLIAAVGSRSENDASLVFGGHHESNEATFEGRIDEISVFARALGRDEIGAHYRAAKSIGQKSN